MKTVKIKTDDDEIIDGYKLELTGELVGANEFAMIVIPPDKDEGENVPCIVFAHYCSLSAEYDYQEVDRDIPFINLYDKQSIKQLLKVYEVAKKGRKT